MTSLCPVTTLRWRPFGKEEWMALSGAESFPDGREPLIAYFHIKPEGSEVVGDFFDACAVIDASGIEVIVAGMYSYSTHAGTPMTIDQGAYIVASLHDMMTVDDLVRLGLTRLT